MFRVLTSRKKSRLTSPRFVVGSVAAHLVVALLAVNAWAAPPEVVVTVDADTVVFPITDDAARPQPPAPVEQVTRTPQPPAADVDVLQTPTEPPKGIAPETPGARPLTPDVGIGGPAVGPPAGPVGPVTPGEPGPPKDFSNVPLDPGMVDVLPTLSNVTETARMLQRNYPEIYAEAGVAGRTIVEVVVESNGRVRPGSARVVDASHPLFGDATLRIIERMRFRPAKVMDQPVAVLVQIPIDWRPAN
jgi:periplasmic protein TonB